MRGNKANIVRVILAVLLSAAIIYCKFQFGIKARLIVVSILMLWCLALFASGWAFALIFTLYSLCVLADVHFYRVYGLSFRQFGEQLFNVMMDTNIQEVVSYLKLFTVYEITAFWVILLLGLALIKTKAIKSCGKWILILLIPAVLLGYPDNFMCEYRHYQKKRIGEDYLIQAKQDFKWNAIAGKNSPQNVVVLIGESHRYDYFTKYWKNLPEIPNLLYFNDMISQSGYTLKAMPQILSRKNVYEDTVLYQESSILKLYEEAGYETHFISYIPRLWKGDDSINFIAMESQNYYLFGDMAHEKFVDDKEVIPLLRKILNNGKKNFVAIKLIGVHYNFQDRYPENYDIIKPSLRGNELSPEVENKTIYLNTYENAINYSTYVIHKIFEEIEHCSKSSLIFFSSDHAFNLFDDGHWGVSNVKETYHIPFMIYGNDLFMKYVDKVKWRNVQSHLDDRLITNDILETAVSLSDITIKDSRNRDLTKAGKMNDNRQVIFSDKSLHVYEQLK